MFDNTLTIVISHYCIFTEALPRLIPRGFRLLSSLPRLRFSSHRGEFAAITFGKDEVLPRANGPIYSSGTVNYTIAIPCSTVVGNCSNMLRTLLPVLFDLHWLPVSYPIVFKLLLLVFKSLINFFDLHVAI